MDYLGAKFKLIRLMHANYSLAGFETGLKIVSDYQA